MRDPIPAIAEIVPAAYDGGCRLLNWRHDARDGMTVTLQLSLPGLCGSHPFRSFQSGRETGQRLLVVVRFPADGANPGVVVHSGEAVLDRWSENDRSGMMVRLVLDDGPDGVQGRHPFFGLAFGPSRGEPLELAAYAIADDESLAGGARVRRRTPFHNLPEVTQSHILCKDVRFQRFLERNLARIVRAEDEREALLGMADRGKEFADAVVRSVLGVSSRAVMNQDGEMASRARVLWKRLTDVYEDEMFVRRFGEPAEA